MVSNVRDRPMLQAKGTSLIELLVSMTLGAIVLGSVGTVYYDASVLTMVATNQISQFRQLNQSAVIIRDSVQRAGYRPTVESMASVSDVYPAEGEFGIGEVVLFKKDAGGWPEIHIRTLGPSSLHEAYDCIGNSMQPDVSVNMVLTYDAEMQAIFCRSEHGNGLKANEPIINRIAAFYATGFAVSKSSGFMSVLEPGDSVPVGQDILHFYFELVALSPDVVFSAEEEQVFQLDYGGEVKIKSRQKAVLRGYHMSVENG